MTVLTPPDGIIDTLYSAATDFDQWPVFLEAFAEEFDAIAAVVQYGNWEAKDFSFFAMHGIDANAVADYTSCLDTDPRTPVFLQYPGRPVSCELHLQPEVWRGSSMNSLFRSLNFEYSVFSVTLLDSRQSITSYGLFRPGSGRHFDENDCLRFGAYKAHIDRTIELQKRFATLEEQKWSALTVLNEMPLGVFICDIQTRILFMNDAAQRISSAGRGLVVRHNELWAEVTDESVALRGMVRDAVESVISNPAKISRSIALQRTDGRRPLHVRISPIWRSNAPFAVQALTRPVCAVYVTDPDLPTETDTEILQRLFGLTKRESEVLENLVHGYSIQETATKIGIAASTVRSHLKVLFEKTQTNNQSSLIKLVTTSPAWREQEHPI